MKGEGKGERGGMFNKTSTENFPKIYLTVAQKPLLLIQVCESWIELSNIKSLNVNTHVSTRKQAKSTRAKGGKSYCLANIHLIVASFRKI